MKMFKKFSTVVLIVVFAVVFVFGLADPTTVFAATSPDLGMADSFAVLAGTAVTNVPTSSITGNVGLKPAAGSNYAGLTAAQVTGTIYAVDATGPAGSVVNPVALNTAKIDLSAAFDALAADACGDGVAGGNGSEGIVDGINYGDITYDLAADTLVPGVYCANVFELSGTLTLDDTLNPGGVWIFRAAAAAAALTTSDGDVANVVFTNPSSSSACDVWWRVASSATIGTGTDFIGNILALTTITMDTGATLSGRALASTGAVTLESNTIANTCPGAGGALHATLRVVKNVENDDGDDQHADDFTLYVKSSGTDVAGSPALGVASPGKTYLLAAGTYVVSEDEDGAYNQSFSGDCNSSGSVTLANGQTKTCTITNDDKKDTDKSAEHEKATPTLPAAGIGPQDQSGAPWNIIVPTEIFIALFSFYLARKKLTI